MAANAVAGRPDGQCQSMYDRRNASRKRKSDQDKIIPLPFHRARLRIVAQSHLTAQVARAKFAVLLKSSAT
jgi:hypothetical protein